MAENVRASIPRHAGVEILTHEDLSNPDQRANVGWWPTSQGFGGLFNRHGWASLRAKLWKTVGDTVRWLYDQIILVEDPGAIVLCMTKDGKVLFVRQYRMVGERLFPGTGYVRRLNEEGLWARLLESLGAWRMELPRGLAKTSEGDDGSTNIEIVPKIAKAEALEEAGVTIGSVQVIGEVNANSTFFAHAQYVAVAWINGIGEANPEALEIIGGHELFDWEQFCQAIKCGGIDCGLSLATIELARAKGVDVFGQRVAPAHE